MSENLIRKVLHSNYPRGGDHLTVLLTLVDKANGCGADARASIDEMALVARCAPARVNDVLFDLEADGFIKSRPPKDPLSFSELRRLCVCIQALGIAAFDPFAGVPQTNDPRDQTYAEWADSEQATCTPLLPPNDPVHCLAQDMGIDDEMVFAAWSWFTERYRHEPPYNKQRSRDWRQVFRDSVRDCWSQYWRCDGEAATWTSAGKDWCDDFNRLLDDRIDMDESLTDKWDYYAW